jgi:antigen 43
MTITISSGVDKSGLWIVSGNPLVVLSGGEVDYSNILSGASATLSSGAVAFELDILSGGVVRGPGEITGGWLESGATITGVTAEGLDLRGGTAIDLTVVGGPVEAGGFANLYVSSGAGATGTVVSSGGIVWDYGSATDTLIESGGLEYIGSGGYGAGDTVQSGGEEVFDTDSVASGILVQHGGVLELGGAASDVTVQSGATLAFGGDLTSNFTAGVVTSTTTVRGATVSSGAFLTLFDATVMSGVTVTLTSGVIADNLTVARGGLVEGSGELGGPPAVLGGYAGYTMSRASSAD